MSALLKQFIGESVIPKMTEVPAIEAPLSFAKIEPPTRLSGGPRISALQTLKPPSLNDAFTSLKQRSITSSPLPAAQNPSTYNAPLRVMLEKNPAARVESWLTDRTLANAKRTPQQITEDFEYAFKYGLTWGEHLNAAVGQYAKGNWSTGTQHFDVALERSWDDPKVRAATYTLGTMGALGVARFLATNGVAANAFSRIPYPAAAAGGATYGGVSTYLLDDGTTSPGVYAFNIVTSSAFGALLKTTEKPVSYFVNKLLKNGTGLNVKSELPTTVVWRGIAWGLENEAMQAVKQPLFGAGPIDQYVAFWTGIGGSMVTAAPWFAENIFKRKTTPLTIIPVVAVMAAGATEVGKLHKDMNAKEAERNAPYQHPKSNDE